MLVEFLYGHWRGKALCHLQLWIQCWPWCRWKSSPKYQLEIMIPGIPGIVGHKWEDDRRCWYMFCETEWCWKFCSQNLKKCDWLFLGDLEMTWEEHAACNVVLSDSSHIYRMARVEPLQFSSQNLAKWTMKAWTERAKQPWGSRLSSTLPPSLPFRRLPFSHPRAAGAGRTWPVTFHIHLWWLAESTQNEDIWRLCLTLAHSYRHYIHYIYRERCIPVFVIILLVIDIDVKSSIVNLHFTQHPRSESLARRLNLCVNTWVESTAATALTGATITMQ